jgi:predicted O-methyltransferase YrrM
MKEIRYILKFLIYKTFALHRKGHGIHSPFMYRFVREVLLDNKTEESFVQIEKIRQTLMQSDRQVFIANHGAGSRQMENSLHKFRHIVRFSSVRPRYDKLLFRLVRYFELSAVIELGTSVGISALYLAAAKPDIPLITIEASAELQDIAKGNASVMGLKNVRFINGSFDEQLDNILEGIEMDIMAFIDGNHTKDATLRYFDMLLRKATPGSVIIIDDIHWSEEMEGAWQAIREHQRVRVNLDLFLWDWFSSGKN